MIRIVVSVLLLLFSPAAMAELLNAPPGPFEVQVGSAGCSYSYFGAWQGGVFDLASGFDWFTAYGTKNRTDGQFQTDEIGKALRSLPLIDLLEQQRAGPTDWKAFASTPLNDSMPYRIRPETVNTQSYLRSLTVTRRKPPAKRWLAR